MMKIGDIVTFYEYPENWAKPVTGAITEICTGDNERETRVGIETTDAYHNVSLSWLMKNLAEPTP